MDPGPDEHPQHEFRGIWIATVANLNWPSRPGLEPTEQQTELTDWFDLAVARGYNAIILQVRSAAQVFYASELEPWSAFLTGTQGADPGYDPLRFAVAEAHARGLELHAWFNPYQLTRASAQHDIADDHLSVRHPDWSIGYAGGRYLDPGLPEVRAWVQDAIMVAVEGYDIDGVHVDDYFYPYPVGGEDFDDGSSFVRYGHGLDRAAWRRQNVNRLIAELGERIKAVKPWVRWGVSPSGVWRNRDTDPDGSPTRVLQSFDDVAADSREWVRQGWIDYIVPQVYWSTTDDRAPYRAVVDWWCDQVAGTGVQLYIGEAAYKIGDSGEPGWQDPDEMVAHLAHTATRPEVAGHCYFSMPYVADDPLGAMSRLERAFYARRTDR